MSETLTSRTVTHMQIPARDLIVDPRVQRSLDTNRALRIMNDFKPNALGVVTVSQREDGTYVILDGQHRHAVRVLQGEEDTPMHCVVHTGLTLAEEAEMFRLLNNTRQPTPLTRFRIRGIEGEPVALDIIAALAAKGWRLGTSHLDGTFAAVSAIEVPYVKAENSGEGNGRKCVDWIIAACTRAYGMDPDGVRKEIVSGLGLVYLRYGEGADFNKLTAQMGAMNGGAMSMVAKARAIKEIDSCTVNDGMARVMVGLINKGRQPDRQIAPWSTAVVEDTSTQE